MAVTYAPNGDTIETAYDGGSADSTDYTVTKNGDYVGRVTIYKAGRTYAATPDGKGHGPFPGSRAAIDFLTA